MVGKAVFCASELCVVMGKGYKLVNEWAFVGDHIMYALERRILLDAKGNCADSSSTLTAALKD